MKFNILKINTNCLLSLKNAIAMRLTYKDWSLEYIVEGNILLVLSLYVHEERKQGTATKLMEMLIDEANNSDADVIEFPYTSFDEEEGMTTEELKEWFEKLWFETIEKYMIWENKWYVAKMEL